MDSLFPGAGIGDHRTEAVDFPFGCVGHATENFVGVGQRLHLLLVLGGGESAGLIDGFEEL